MTNVRNAVLGLITSAVLWGCNDPVSVYHTASFTGAVKQLVIAGSDVALVMTLGNDYREQEVAVVVLPTTRIRMRGTDRLAQVSDIQVRNVLHVTATGEQTLHNPPLLVAAEIYIHE